MKPIPLIIGALLITLLLSLTIAVTHLTAPAQSFQHNLGTCLDRFSPLSPDGRQVLFASDEDGDSEIFIMDNDGSHQRQLTYNDAWDGQPVWSEDGRQIYFASNREGAIAFYAITDGAGVIKLEGELYQPSKRSIESDGLNKVQNSSNCTLLQSGLR